MDQPRKYTGTDLRSHRRQGLARSKQWLAIEWDALEDKEAVAQALNDIIARDLPVTDDWITDAELEANPGLVKTMSVKPPMGAGRVRLVRIGDGDAQVDLQPCGGTHVKRTSEIGPVRIGKVEKKGKQNRRVNLFLEDGA